MGELLSFGDDLDRDQQDVTGSALALSPADWGVRGQQAAVSSLRRAIESERLAHAYLFTGPVGVGKGTLARRLAQTLACMAPAAARPCQSCRACRKIEQGELPDVEWVSIGGVCDESRHRDHATDNSTRVRICQVRRLERMANLAPFAAQRRVFVVDRADDLQAEAAHALLKILEEPPHTVLLVLLSADPDSLLPTVRSRCQELALRPLGRAELEAALIADGVGASEAARLSVEAAGRYGLARRALMDPSVGQLRETALADVRRLASAGLNERFDYAETLARRWSRERQSVRETLGVWEGWWREQLSMAANGRSGAACTPSEALRALRALRRAHERLLANVTAELALDVMMLDLPLLPAGATGVEGEEARPAAAPDVA